MKITLIFFFLLFSVDNYAQKENLDTPSKKVTSEDLMIIVGNWTGNITYLDYRTNKPFTMPANVTVKQGKNKDQLFLYNVYHNEPKANNREKIKVSKNGTMLNKKRVNSRVELPDGQIQIKTKSTGKDDNKKALIQYTYLLAENQFIIRKEVQFENSKDWIKRSEFSYTR